jgi:hypothetical protein
MTDEPKSLQEAEELLRRRPTLRRDDLHLPSPQAVALWRELRSWGRQVYVPAQAAVARPRVRQRLPRGLRPPAVRCRANGVQRGMRAMRGVP